MSQKQMQFDKDIENILNGIGKLTMLKDLDVKSFADEGCYADKLAVRLKGKLKTTQLRRFFDAIKGIEKKMLEEKKWDKVEADFYLLKPKLAYARGRKLIPDEFHQVVRASLNKIDKGNEQEKIENYKRFVQFLEAVVAYHKYYGGD